MQYVYKVEDVEPLEMGSATVGGHVHGENITLRFLSDPTVANTGMKNSSVIYIEFGVGGGTNPHKHPDFEQMYFILGGEAIFYIGAQEHKVGANTLVVIPPNTSHNVKVLGDVPFRFLEMSAPPLPIDLLREANILKD
ncbi:MAG: cupin domain-containing protein [Deltaproteobacteria bacterium]|nr:cupin domain-containing protein [Deltaproteobacteria bacterium]